MTQNKLCYECFDDYIYATVGFEGAAEAEEYYVSLVEGRVAVKCPNCKRVVDYGKER